MTSRSGFLYGDNSRSGDRPRDRDHGERRRSRSRDRDRRDRSRSRDRRDNRRDSGRSAYDSGRSAYDSGRHERERERSAPVKSKTSGIFQYLAKPAAGAVKPTDRTATNADSDHRGGFRSRDDPPVDHFRVNAHSSGAYNTGANLRDNFSTGVNPDKQAQLNLPYLCKEDGKRFCTSTQLSDHLKSVHNIHMHASLLKPDKSVSMIGDEEEE
jgi:hypothetical protein